MRTPEPRLAGGRVDRAIRTLSEGGYFLLSLVPAPPGVHYCGGVVEVHFRDAWGRELSGVSKGTLRTFRQNRLVERVFGRNGELPQVWKITQGGMAFMRERREQNRYGAWSHG